MLLKRIVILNILMTLAAINGSAKNDSINYELPTIDTTSLTPLSLYNSLGSNKPRYDVFERAYQGYKLINSKIQFNKSILTIIDYELPSVNNRMWVIDVEKKEVLFCELVAHGKNSGENYASRFSNIPESNMSSLGFFTTGETYYGKHGLSLYLNGIQKGLNDKARERNIVIHGADYVSRDFIKKYGRLGRSLGCPALPIDSNKNIITTIKNKTCVYINGNAKEIPQNENLLLTDFVE